MAEISTKKIYRLNEQLEEQLPLWTFMSIKKQAIFVKDIRALIVVARQCEINTKTERVKNRLRNIIENWEDFLDLIENESNEDFAMISRFDKTSATPSKNRAEEHSIISFVRSIPLNISKLISQSMSDNKFDLTSPVSIPHNPELRAIYDELYGAIDSRGETK